MDRNLELSIGQSITQDISNPSPYLYVYKTPELAVSSESGYSSKEFSEKIASKTIIKLMCWGNSIESTKKVAFTNMCVVENIGYKINETLTTRATSKIRNTKLGSPNRKFSPRSIKGNHDLAAYRVYSSVAARKKSPVRKGLNNALKTQGNVQLLLLKMKEENERLDQEVKDIEAWNKLLELEELDTINSSENLELSENVFK